MSDAARVPPLWRLRVLRRACDEQPARYNGPGLWVCVVGQTRTDQPRSDSQDAKNNDASAILFSQIFDRKMDCEHHPDDAVPYVVSPHIRIHFDTMCVDTSAKLHNYLTQDTLPVLTTKGIEYWDSAEEEYIDKIVTEWRVLWEIIKKNIVIDFHEDTWTQCNAMLVEFKKAWYRGEYTPKKGDATVGDDEADATIEEADTTDKEADATDDEDDATVQTFPTNHKLLTAWIWRVVEDMMIPTMQVLAGTSLCWCVCENGTCNAGARGDISVLVCV